MSNIILDVQNLSMHYETLEGNVLAVKDVSFNVKSGESFGLVGESGCGKTSVAMTLLQLQPENSVISEGSIKLDGKELIGLSENELRKVRWDSISIVFQALIHMAVNVDFFPVTGQTLPLVSMGGVSIFFTCLTIGVILSTSKEISISKIKV